MIISPEHEDLLVAMRPRTRPWRRMTIAVDGVDGAGKSSLARFLAWQLGMPAIETDLLLSSRSEKPEVDTKLLSGLVAARHDLNRPVIVEGVFVLRWLSNINVEADFLIKVEASGHLWSRSWARQFAKYVEDFPRANVPDYKFSWDPGSSS